VTDAATVIGSQKETKKANALPIAHVTKIKAIAKKERGVAPKKEIDMSQHTVSVCSVLYHLVVTQLE